MRKERGKGIMLIGGFIENTNWFINTVAPPSTAALFVCKVLIRIGGARDICVR